MLAGVWRVWQVHLNKTTEFSKDREILTGKKQKHHGCHTLTNDICHLSQITKNLSKCTYSLSEWITLYSNYYSIDKMSQTSFSLYLHNQWTDFHILSCAGKPQVRAIHTYVGCTKVTTNDWDIRTSVAVKALSANISWTAERIRTIELH